MVIITFGTNVNGGDTVFNDGVRIYNLGLRVHVLKYLYGICIAGPFLKVCHEGTIWRSNREVISFILHKKTPLHLYHNGDVFKNRYIETEGKKI